MVSVLPEECRLARRRPPRRARPNGWRL